MGVSCTGMAAGEEDAQVKKCLTFLFGGLGVIPGSM